jgi:uncharacterized protein YbbC (DUF1343 family)
MIHKFSLFLLLILQLTFCSTPVPKRITCGAERGYLYLDPLKGKKVAIVANQTSIVDSLHLVDYLLKEGIEIKRIFAPEHGFRGEFANGATVQDDVDIKTGLKLVSLYNNNHKPAKEHIEDIDIVIFDIQDVGVRFYTYISTLHYVMEACAENNVKLLIFDRPNPNGFYIDGPVMENEYTSFVGMHTIPIVHGMTIAEYACMINGEGWLNDGIKCDLEFVLCENYTHDSLYHLPVPPSPNLPDMRSVYLYPSTGLFEGVDMNEGRGTQIPFQVYGHPKMKNYDTVYTPIAIPGKSMYPVFKGQQCYGRNLSKIPLMKIVENRQINLGYIIDAYNDTGKKQDFFNPYFYNLTGTASLRNQLQKSVPVEEIRKSWQSGLQQFSVVRKKYLLYPDYTI